MLSISYLSLRVIIATSVKFAQLLLVLRPIEINTGVSGNGEVVSVLKLTKHKAKQMQSNRIKSIQKRANRRILASAIITTAFVGYNALSLFAEDVHPIQLSVAKLSTAPGVKAVGIRLINPNPKSSVPVTEPAPMLTSGGPALLLPPTSSVGMGAEPQPNKVETMLLTPTLPVISSGTNPTQSTTGFSSLMPPPPPMSDVLTTYPNGKVVVKIGSSENVDKSQNQNTGLASLPEPSQIGPREDSALVRMTLGDSMSKTQAPNRTPQIVKSKPTQITHSVVLAQSTDLGVSNSDNQSSDIGSMVEIDTSAVLHTISKDLQVSGSKHGTRQQARVAVTDLVQDPIRWDASHSSVGVTAKSEMAKSDVTDSLRRKFDTRVSYQSPVATVELECLAATTMSLSGTLVAVAVQDEKICKILHNDRTVSLVGNQTGSTLVQIWTADLGNSPQVIRVNVSQPWGNVQATNSEVKDIKQVIAQKFPRADVSIISKDDGGIEVRGTTDSEESAKRILELVRKLYLVPVTDKVTVSN